VAVAISTVFGVGMALLLVRYEFPGKRLLSAFIDLPLAVSPVVVGLSLVLVYGGRDGWFGPWLEDHGVQVVFAVPGMVLATDAVNNNRPAPRPTIAGSSRFARCTVETTLSCSSRNSSASAMSTNRPPFPKPAFNTTASTGRLARAIAAINCSTP